MHKLKILIRKSLRAIDTRAPRTISVQKITTLDHKLLDYAVELRAFVPLRPAQMVLRLACAELAEVLGGSGDGVGEEFHFDPAKWFAAECHVEEDYGVGVC